MRVRPGPCLAALVFALAGVAAEARAADVKPPANEDCMMCHEDTSTTRADGSSVAVDPKKFETSLHGPMACVDCHEDLAKNPELPHADKLSKVNCASCHADEGANYHDSIHFRARDKAGLKVAPSCADCHGKHDIKPPSDEASRVARANVPATCGSCHEGITHKYEAGVHAAALKAGNPKAPICADCHTAHSIQRADTDAWRLSVTAECGTCHENVVASFRRTFHGKVTELGFTRVAACADCHGAHDILPKSNPASMVSKQRLVETCARCHEGANEQFVKYDPHPDPTNYARSPVLWWINQFYTVLIAGCFGFFGLHSLLWFRRSWGKGGHS
jgi:nitrate/TMAO reductase-like tetraheme cytochrome c subunit